jgi:tRNA threonylcarbamoyladenosine biosynthesis protein TsaB
MSLILSIETSTPLCSVAIHSEGKLLATKETLEEGGHGKRLTRLIEAACEEANLTIKDIDAVAISIGPGSYTGLRIGLAAAKGLCFGLDKPLIRLNTLKIMANAWADHSEKLLLLPMIDARRMEVYAAVFDGLTHMEIEKAAALILEPNSFEQLKQPAIAFGNGALKWQESCENKLIRFSNENPYPQAKFMGKDAFQAYQKQDFALLIQAEPEYLKEFMGTKPKNKAL